jgi:signal transduction histidine kinase
MPTTDSQTGSSHTSLNGHSGPANRPPAEDQRWFLVGLRPYRTVADKIDGVVVTGVDVSANKAYELALETKVAKRTAQLRELVTQLTASEQEERRRISALLHDESLPEAIRWPAALMQQQHGLAVTVEAAPELPPLDEDVRVLLYYLCTAA